MSATRTSTALPGSHMARLLDLFRAARPVTVITGAGCSTASGIPDYRARDGRWKRSQPIQYMAFVRDETARRRYWSRSMIGWPRIAGAMPNRTHRCLAELERAGWVETLITQNVDGLHQKAGNCDVLELHGGLDEVECLACAARQPRAALQSELERRNPEWRAREGDIAPDGDVDLDDSGLERFAVPVCACCGGMLKPAVVFFGESVPRERVARASAQVERSRALIAVGSSLMVFSGYRFMRQASRNATPTGVINRGATRADTEVDLKLDSECGDVLSALVSELL